MVKYAMFNQNWLKRTKSYPFVAGGITEKNLLAIELDQKLLCFE